MWIKGPERLRQINLGNLPDAPVDETVAFNGNGRANVPKEVGQYLINQYNGYDITETNNNGE